MVRRYITKFTAEGPSLLFSAVQGYWPLQEPGLVRYDFKGPHNLTDVNTVGTAAGPGGAYPNAALFVRANSERLSVGDSAALSAGDTEFNIIGWFYLTSDPGADMHICGKWQAAGSREYLLYFQTTANRFIFAVSADGTAYSEDVQADVLGTPATGTWYFIHAYHSASSNLLGISVNGGAYDTQAYSGGVADTSAEFRIGDGDGAFFDGRAAGVQFLKGGIISTAERDALYNSGVPRSPMSFRHIDLNNTNSFTPLLNLYEYSPMQTFREPIAQLSGAGYAYRSLGGFPALKGVGVEKIRFADTRSAGQRDDELDWWITHAVNGGLGRLWSIGDDGEERWCWASLAQMPEFVVNQPNQFTQYIWTFNRWSNWMNKYQRISHFDTGNTGDTFHTETLVGSAPVYDAILTIRGDSWTNPFWNNSPSYFNNTYIGNFQTSRDISAVTQRIRMDGGHPFLGWSTDNGQTYADDWANYNFMDSRQWLYTILVPGGNLFVFQGTRSNTRGLLEYFEQWHG